MPKSRANPNSQTAGLEKDDLVLLIAIAVSTAIGILAPSFGII